MESKNPRTIVHVDMDAFYAAIEQLDHRAFRNKPVVVGADPMKGQGRGVVSAASYEARKYGIHSAMPISQAFRLCPTALFVRPRMKRYMEVSKRIMEILNEFSPVIEQISIDEAFLDCTGTENLIGPPPILGNRIKDSIRKQTSLTASVGIATNKSIAKIASELGKPDGLTICASGNEKKFLGDLPLTYLWGAGKKTVKKLESLGFKKIGDIALCSTEQLIESFGKVGRHLWELANGIDERSVQQWGGQKSISEETTFHQDVSSDQYIEHVLFKISDRLSRRMRNLGIKGRTVTVKIRLENFDTHTKSHTLSSPVNDMPTIRFVGNNLFRNFDRKKMRIRLIGIGVSNFDLIDHGEEQLELFQDEKGKDAGRQSLNTDELLDAMKRKYGAKVTRASFLKNFFENGQR